MDELHWRQLSATRVEEARCLLAAGHWAGAYYLAGYAVECLLKALAIRQLLANPGQVFGEGNYQADVRTHDFARLLRRLKLAAQLDTDAKADPILEKAWEVVFEWDESDRYEFVDEPAARILLDAITDPQHGVLEWISRQF